MLGFAHLYSKNSSLERSIFKTIPLHLWAQKEKYIPLKTYLFLALFGGTPAPSPFSGAASTSPFAGSGAPVFGGPALIGKLNFKLKITQIR